MCQKGKSDDDDDDDDGDDDDDDASSQKKKFREQLEARLCNQFLRSI